MADILVLSASLGNYPTLVQHVEQRLPEGHSVDYLRLTDKTFPPRRSMSPRFQSRIPKLVGWTVAPGYPVYVWMDADFQLNQADSLKAMLTPLESADVVFFRHPFRSTVGEEADFLRQEQPRSRRLMLRYEGEDLEGLMQLVDPGLPLYACGVFAYRDTPEVRDATMRWWYLASRYHHNDQLSASYVFQRLRVAVIDLDIYHNPLVWFARRRRV